MTPQTVTIHDAASGASARVLAGFGFNCFSFVTMHGGKPIDALWTAEDFEKGEGRASGNGIPLLFPFPGRIGGGRYEFAGQEYQLDVADGRNNAIHGFVLNRPWQVVEQAADRVVGRFQASAVDAAILKHWPSDFVLTVAYSVKGQCLRAEFTAQNPGPNRLPFGLGAHPYFCLPLGPGGDADRCVVSVPVRQSWELVDMLPTGKLLSGPVHQKLSGGMPFAETQFDDVFTGVAHQGGRARAMIDDPVSGRALRIEFADTFRECVVYNPPHRDSICIEPYTCVPDPFRLTAAGIDAGLRVLGSGETFATWMEIHVD
jgi:aldose 1-epimerase